MTTVNLTEIYLTTGVTQPRQVELDEVTYKKCPHTGGFTRIDWNAPEIVPPRTIWVKETPAEIENLAHIA